MKKSKNNPEKPLISTRPSKSAERPDNVKKNVKKNQRIRLPRIGDIVDVRNIEDVGIVPQSLPQRQHRRQMTGTEEILEEFIVLDDEAGPSSKSTKAKSPRKTRKNDKSSTNSTLSRSSKSLPRFGYEKDDESSSYAEVWEKALKNPDISTTEEYEKPEKIAVSAIPFPPTQAVRFVNKFSKRQLSLKELAPETSAKNEHLLFSNEAKKRQSDGIHDCSKIAGKILKQMFDNPDEFDSMFTIQLPNSLRVFDHKTLTNDDNKDLKVDEIGKNKYEQDFNTPLFVNNNSRQRQIPQTLALANFNHEIPFGKLQLLKSGRIVLKIANRQFDLVSYGNKKEYNLAAIFDFEGLMETNPKKQKPPQNQRQPTLKILGQIDHCFSAFYDYSKILENVPQNIPKPKQMEILPGKPIEVDLTKDPEKKVPDMKNAKKQRSYSKKKTVVKIELPKNRSKILRKSRKR
uniref:Uncharacterized protein n=1 Tax=Panagrolaimus sp. JU765 TaxID=591449 RepID=A0AC34Q9D2_9BILA